MPPALGFMQVMVTESTVCLGGKPSRLTVGAWQGYGAPRPVNEWNDAAWAAALFQHWNQRSFVSNICASFISSLQMLVDAFLRHSPKLSKVGPQVSWMRLARCRRRCTSEPALDDAKTAVISRNPFRTDTPPRLLRPGTINE